MVTSAWLPMRFAWKPSRNDVLALAVVHGELVAHLAERDRRSDEGEGDLLVAAEGDVGDELVVEAVARVDAETAVPAGNHMVHEGRREELVVSPAFIGVRELSM